ncbi:MAG: hypothetical protein GX987_10060 [Tissierellia bacterium]|nr:hypothetical protein [Tissierellia bacterium]
MIIFEIAIGVFAGYCCMYFVSMKLVKSPPEKLIEEFLKNISDKLKENRKYR